MYIFNHSSQRNPDSLEFGSVHGSELPFIFGMPLGELKIIINLSLFRNLINSTSKLNILYINNIYDYHNKISMKLLRKSLF